MRRIAFALGLMFVVAACGGILGEPTDDGTTIVSSADGRAVLTFAAESLPEGVNATDVHVEFIDVTSTEPGAPGVVVRLTPDGLVLNEPASLRFELPDMGGNQIVVTHVTEKGFEFVGGTIEDIGDQRHLVTPVEHFSLFAATVVEGLTTIVGSADPAIVDVGQSQLVTWEVWIEPISFGMWIPIGPNAEQVQFVMIDDVQLSKTSKIIGVTSIGLAQERGVQMPPGILTTTTPNRYFSTTYSCRLLQQPSAQASTRSIPGFRREYWSR